MGGRVSSPTLVGRVEELHVLEAARVRAAAGEPAVVLLGGEAGVGKSRLLAELAARCSINRTPMTATRGTTTNTHHHLRNQARKPFRFRGACLRPRVARAGAVLTANSSSSVVTDVRFPCA